jgi:lysophospholipase L1-like esterase
LAARIEELKPKLAVVYSEIRKRSPKARVLALGYLRLLPPENGCFPKMPIATGDVPYLNRVHVGLNEAVHAAVDSIGGTYVDAFGPSLDHDACQEPEQKWVEGLLPSSAAFPVHPNAAGMRAMSDLVTAEIESPAPKPTRS